MEVWFGNSLLHYLTALNNTNWNMTDPRTEDPISFFLHEKQKYIFVLFVLWGRRFSDIIYFKPHKLFLQDKPSLRNTSHPCFTSERCYVFSISSQITWLCVKHQPEAKRMNEGRAENKHVKHFTQTRSNVLSDDVYLLEDYTSQTQITSERGSEQHSHFLLCFLAITFPMNVYFFYYYCFCATNTCDSTSFHINEATNVIFIHFDFKIGCSPDQKLIKCQWMMKWG